MSVTASSPLDWTEIDTVFVDMDGTLLDLAFDNFFWLELVPARYAERHGVTAETARERLSARFDAAAGTLSWYCLDHWTRQYHESVVLPRPLDARPRARHQDAQA